MTDSLWFTWGPAAGDVDFYELNLYNPNGTQKETWHRKDLKEWHFQGLVPGRKYRLVVVTHSGDLTNTADAEGRTGKKHKSLGIFVWSHLSEFILDHNYATDLF